MKEEFPKSILVGGFLMAALSILGILFITSTFRQTETKLNTVIVEKNSQLDILFIKPALEKYKRKNPKATKEDLLEVEYLLRLQLEALTDNNINKSKTYIDPRIMFNLMMTESNATIGAVGPVKLAHGLPALCQFQINPVHFEELSQVIEGLRSPIDLLDPRICTEAAVYLFSKKLNLSNGDIRQALFRYGGWINKQHEEKAQAYANKGQEPLSF